MTTRLKVLALAPHVDGHDIGESLTAYQLLRELSKAIELTVLALECTKGPPLRNQLPDAEVVVWDEPVALRTFERMRAMLRPNILLVSYFASRWVRDQFRKGRSWDVAHQLLPAAPRYPTIFRKFPIPYLIGSLGGALPTPTAFASECSSAQWYTHLRRLDSWRFRYDPFLRSSYSKAEIVLGVAPYMAETLKTVPIKRFEPYLAIGVDDVEAPQTRKGGVDCLHLLHVGRAVRTKGLRDVVRAMAHLTDRPGITLTSIGGGEEVDICRRTAENLNIADRVTFLGKLPRDEIEEYYKKSDVFVYPSFRESMGGVLFEAMRWSLPVVSVRNGGPDFIVKENQTGLKVDVTDPEQMPRDLADAIKTLHDRPELRMTLGDGGREDLIKNHLWSVKVTDMVRLYQEVADRELEQQIRREEQ